MPQITRHMQITAGDLSEQAFFQGMFHLFGSQPRYTTISELPVPAAFVISGVSWMPFAGLKNLSRAFRWIRVQRAAEGYDGVQFAAQAQGEITGRIIVAVQIEITAPVEVEVANDAPLTLDTHGFRRVLNKANQETITLPTTRGAVGTEFFIKTNSVQSGKRVALALENSDDAIEMALNPTDEGRAQRGKLFSKIQTEETGGAAAGQVTTLSCRQEGIWVAESRSEKWEGV